MQARFVPEAHYHQLMAKLATASCPHTDDELDRIAQEPGIALSQIWEELGAA